MPQKLHRPYKTDLPVRIPSKRLEYVYYFAVIYSVMAPAVGLEMPLVAGLLILAISAYCVIQFLSSARVIYRPIMWLIGCAVSLVLIQVLVHGESLLDSTIRAYIIWILSLIIVRTLCFRPGFSFRFPLLLFAIGIVTIPFIGIAGGEMDKARVDIAVQGGLTHPGGLAEWFGFLAVYFTVIGTQTKRASFRTAAFLIAVGCLLIVTLTIERSPIFAAAVAITVALRRMLKRGFVPTLMLVLLAGGIYASGLFDSALSKYAERGLEETGREILWPVAVNRIFESPLFGVGESRIYIPFGKKDVPPHNVFLHLALSSGVIPFALFFAFWCQALLRSVIRSGPQITDQMRLPFLIFTFVPVMLGDWSYMSPYALLSVSLGAGSLMSYQPNATRIVQRTGHAPQLRINRRSASAAISK